ncbi:MAG: NAD(P)H-binding protein [Gemmatimonadales bacterium]
MTSNKRSVVLVGATGLVGAECLTLLLADPVFDRVVVLARRPLEGVGASPKLAAHVVDFERLEAHADLFTADQLICCLGTTISKAGSTERFRAVDFGIPFALAKLGAERGVRHFLLVSALGADARSRVFYNRVKGELEDALSSLPFRSLSIVRPSLLLGDRREFRLGESIAQRFAFLMPGKYAAIRARDVAAALVRLAKEDAPGRRVVESAEMRAWAASIAGGAR